MTVLWQYILYISEQSPAQSRVGPDILERKSPNMQFWRGGGGGARKYYLCNKRCISKSYSYNINSKLTHLQNHFKSDTENFRFMNDHFGWGWAVLNFLMISCSFKLFLNCSYFLILPNSGSVAQNKNNVLRNMFCYCFIQRNAIKSWNCKYSIHKCDELAYHSSSVLFTRITTVFNFMWPLGFFYQKQNVFRLPSIMIPYMEMHEASGLCE